MGFSEHSLILKNDNTLWGCGYNYYGNLGLGDIADRKIFTKVTTNADNVKLFPNQYNIPTIIKVYDLNTGLIETLDTNNFKNIPDNSTIPDAHSHDISHGCPISGVK